MKGFNNNQKTDVQEVVAEIFEDAANNGTCDNETIAELTRKKVRSRDTNAFQTKADILQMIMLAGPKAAECYIRNSSMPQNPRTESLVSKECFEDLVALATQYREVIISIDAALKISNPQGRKRRLEAIVRKHPNCKKRLSELIHLREAV